VERVVSPETHFPPPLKFWLWGSFISYNQEKQILFRSKYTFQLNKKKKILTFTDIFYMHYMQASLVTVSLIMASLYKILPTHTCCRGAVRCLIRYEDRWSLCLEFADIAFSEQFTINNVLISSKLWLIIPEHNEIVISSIISKSYFLEITHNSKTIFNCLFKGINTDYNRNEIYTNLAAKLKENQSLRDTYLNISRLNWLRLGYRFGFKNRIFLNASCIENHVELNERFSKWSLMGLID
jgi:hypothetical protein